MTESPENRPQTPPSELPYAPPPPPPMPYAAGTSPLQAPRNGLGTAALILAIIGLVLCWTVAGGIVLGIVAVILGFIGRSRVKRGEANNGGIALAGIILGALSLVAGIAFIVIYVAMFNWLGIDEYANCLDKAGQDPAARHQCEDQFRHRLETKLSVTLTTTP